MNRSSYINSKIEHYLGVPIVESELEPSQFASAIDRAMLRFYTAHPIQMLYQSPASTGTTSVSVDDITKSHWSDLSDEVYFLGVINTEYTLPGEQSLQGFDAFLAGQDGRNRVYNPFGKTGLAPFDAMKPTQALTERDLRLGEEAIRYNPVTRELVLTAPASGELTLTICYGYSGNNEKGENRKNSWDYAEHAYLELISDLASESVITTIIQARSGVEFSSTATINISALQDTLTDLKEKNEQYLNSIASPVLFFG